VLPDLVAQATANPLDERLGGQLMLALYRCGRQAEALQAYRQLGARLADELGVDPGPELQRLHTAMVRGNVEPVPALPVAAPKPVRPAPAQLPLDVYGFTGREPELARLDGFLDAAGGATTVVVSTIAGTAGAGKTALAVRWAHRVAGRFPDGQLFANLRGYDAEQMVAPDTVSTGGHAHYPHRQYHGDRSHYAVSTLTPERRSLFVQALESFNVGAGKLSHAPGVRAAAIAVADWIRG
jgi:hypothetical protein